MPKEYNSTEQLDSEVLFVLNMHRSEGNPIKRLTLVRRIFGEDAIGDEADSNNNYDRAVRAAIQRLRESGQTICSRPNGAGYYMAATREEYEQFLISYLGANFKKFKAVAAMNTTADARWGKQPKPAPKAQPALL